MTKVIYTVCTPHFFCHAEVMVASFLKHNDGYKAFAFIINNEAGLTNNYTSSVFAILIASEDIVPGFTQMASQYNNFELCCALKPGCALFLAQKLNYQTIVYLDTDIYVLNSFSTAEKLLMENSVLITPHSTTPLPNDGLLPKEADGNNSGIYNAGFFAIKNDEDAIGFLNWWHEKMLLYCYVDFCKGFFVDQIWLNKAPIYFKKIKLLCNPGYNTAYWNLHERKISMAGNNYTVNAEFDLVFVHLSGYDIMQPTILSKHQTRYHLSELQALNQIYHDYATLVKARLDRNPIQHIEKKQKKWSVLRFFNKIIAFTGFAVTKK
jgi:lipopolysaccharide biosynthesis glycosyltransferase